MDIKIKMKTLTNIKKNIVLLLCCIIAVNTPLVLADTSSLDSVVAVVEKDVIMRSELDKRVAEARQQITSHNAPMPPDDVLIKQVLNSLILESIQLQMADHLGIKVDDDMLNQQMAKIASQNNMSLAQFSQALTKEGTNYPAVREQVRREMIISQLRQRQVVQHIHINDQEVSHAVNNKSKQAVTEYHLAGIMIKPTSNTPQAIQDAQKQATDIYNEVKNGRNFAQLAAAHSKASNAKSGGDLGWRQPSQLPPNISDAIASLNVNDVAPPFQDQQGIHIIKILGKREAANEATPAPTAVIEYHARHILISPSKIRNDDQSQKLITQIKEQIDQGADFAKLAKKYSDDPSSASQGGDLGWSVSKKFVPEFAHELETLSEKTVSAPFKTKFGWHILEVLESRNQNNTAQQQEEDTVRASIRKQKYEDELQKWLRQIRQEAFVDIKLDK